MVQIKVVNRSDRTVEVFVSKYSNSNGDDKWYTLHAGDQDTYVSFLFHQQAT
jgi:hypothetical protein